MDCQLRVKELCRKLVELLVTEDDLRSGNATEARTAGVKLLDSHKLYAIAYSHYPCTIIIYKQLYLFTVHCLYRFPEEGGLNSLMEKERWKKLKKTVINVMCREVRAKKKNLWWPCTHISVHSTFSSWPS